MTFSSTCISSADDNESLSFEPVLNEEEGFYQLGPTTEPSEIYVLSVTISYAVNLAKVMLKNKLY